MLALDYSQILRPGPFINEHQKDSFGEKINSSKIYSNGAKYVDKILNHNLVWFQIDRVNPTSSAGTLQLHSKFYEIEIGMCTTLQWLTPSTEGCICTQN